jgi:pyruvate dehydrogenase E1 component alpha subunit
MNIKIPEYLTKVREVSLTPEELMVFEEKVKEVYEAGDIAAPVHLTKNNEKELIEIFQYVHENDWVFSSWRNHYHALLHGISKENLFEQILAGNSMSVNSVEPKFYSSSIVGGIIPIALGTAKALQDKGSKQRVWCFIGDMTYETGVFHESYKYCKNFNLPLQFVVEDNNMSTNTPTDDAWGGKSTTPSDVIYYAYNRGYPHHGTGNWVLF